MRKMTIIVIMIVILLFTSVIVAEIVDQDPTFYIEKGTQEWKTVHKDGNEANFDVHFLNAKDKKTEICFVLKEGMNPGDVNLTDKSLYDKDGNPILDDKDKGITLKYESSKCDVGGVMKDGYHISLTAVQSVNIDNYIKLGENSIVNLYQQESKVVYDESDYQVNVTLYKWNGEEFVLAPDEVFINSTNPNKLKFGAYDNFSKDTTKYKYVFTSNREIDGQYRIYSGTNLKINRFFSKPQYRYIDTSDICIENANCSYNLTHITSLGEFNNSIFEKSQLEVEFYAFYNEVEDLIFIDPSFNLVYDSSDDIIFNNQTEASNLGARLDAPILFMDFDNEPDAGLKDFSQYRTYATGQYVQDDSVYNNYGTTSGLISSELFWVEGNVSGNKSLEFDGTGDARSENTIANTNGNFTVSFWINKPTSNSEVPFVHGTPDRVVQIFGSNALTCRALQSGSVWVGRSSGTAVSGGDWHHYACTFNGTTDATGIKIYVDGVQADNADDTNGAFSRLNDNANTVIVGSQGSSQLDGKMNHVMYFNRSLNETEIDWIYGNQSIGNNSVFIDDANLMHYWGLNESSGYTSYDVLGINNLTLTNYPAETNPIYNQTCDSPAGGNCYTFDGVDGKGITLPFILDPTTEPSFSAFAWVKTDGSFTGNKVILQQDDDSGTGRSWLTTSNGAFGTSIEDGSFVSSGVSIDDSEWHQVGFVFDGANVNQYVDGILEQSNADTSPSGDTTAGLLIGKFKDGTLVWNGSIDHVQIWDRALSADEVLKLYNNTNTVLDYRFDNTQGLIDNDSITSDHSTYKGTGNVHGAFFNTTCTSPAGGTCYSFTGGNSDHINLSDGDEQDAQTITFSYWARFNASQSHDIFYKRPTSGLPQWYSQYNYVTQRYIFAVWKGGLASTVGTGTNSVLNTDFTWHHIAHSYNGIADGTSEMRMYLDGELVENNSNAIYPISSQDCNITFGNNYLATSSWSGDIDQFRMWDRVLTDNEVRQLYQTDSIEYIGKYSKEGDFKSNVFYNSTLSYWNISFDIATGNGTKDIFDILTDIPRDEYLNATWYMGYEHDSNPVRSVDTCENNTDWTTNTDNTFCIERTATKLGGCSPININYTEAKDFCEANGTRLCTLYEIQSGLSYGTGCSLNNQNLWSSSSCSDGERWVLEDDDRPQNAFCYPESSTIRATVCCMDTNASKFTGDWSLSKDQDGIVQVGGVSANGVEIITDGQDVEEYLAWNSQQYLAFSTWYYSDTADTLQYIVSRGASTDHEYFRRNADNTFGWDIKDSGEQVEVTTPDTYASGQWYHIFGFFDGTEEAVIYINGERVANDTTDMGTSGTPTGDIGFGASGMVLSDTRLYWRRDFTDAEVKEIYEMELTKNAKTNITLQTRTASSYNTSDAGLRVLYSLEDENVTYTSLSGNRNFTVTGDAYFNYSEGVVGKGLYCDGSSDYLTTTSPFTTGVGGNNFISLWFYATTEKANMAIFSSGNSVSDGTPYFLVRIDSGDLEVWTGSGYVTAKSDIELNRWYHLGVEKTSINGKVWLDGELVKTLGVATSGSNSNLYICAGFNAQFKGYIDEIRVYAKSPTNAEVLNLYELSDHHIEWNEWNDEGQITDITPMVVTDTGNFLQYRAFYNSDNPDVSPYIINHSMPMALVDISAPNINWTNPTTNNDTYTDQTYIIYNVTCTDDIAIDTINVTLYDSDNAIINSTTSGTSPLSGNFSNLPYDTYNLTAFCTDLESKINYTENKTITLVAAPEIVTLPAGGAAGTYGDMSSKCDTVADTYGTCYFLNTDNYCEKGCPTGFECNENSNRCEEYVLEDGVYCKPGYTRLGNTTLCVPESFDQKIDPFLQGYAKVSNKFFGGKLYVIPILLVVISSLYLFLNKYNKKNIRQI